MRLPLKASWVEAGAVTIHAMASPGFNAAVVVVPLLGLVGGAWANLRRMIH